MSAKNDIDFLASLKANQSIQLQQTVTNWEEAVLKVFEPLKVLHAVTDDYATNVIAKTKALGPYYIIAPYLAMPHSRPEDGALKNSFSLMSLTKPTLFPNNEKVSLLIGFAATDAHVHLSLALPQIVAIFENPKIVNQIIEAKTQLEVFAIIKQIDYMKYVS